MSSPQPQSRNWPATIFAVAVVVAATIGAILLANVSDPLASGQHEAPADGGRGFVVATADQQWGVHTWS